MGLTKDTLSRRLALAMDLVTNAGGPERIDALPLVEKLAEIRGLEDMFMLADGANRDVALHWIAKALRRQRHPGRQRGTAPDTSLHLGAERREWLQAQGGIQPGIIRLIDREMGK